jgi:hypothetical protein
VSGYWTPSKQQLTVLENLLPSYFENIILLKPLSELRRAYAGLIYKGRKIIYIDFTYITDPDWTPIKVVCNGDREFLGIEFDVETGTFSHLYSQGLVTLY